MTICFADDFGGYGTNTAFMLNGLYAQIDNAALVEDPDPNLTGTVFNSGVNAVNGTRLRRVLPASVTTAGFAFRMWMSALPSGTGTTLSFGLSDNANTNQVIWTVDPTGRIVVRSGTNFATVLATSVNPVLVANAWNHIEAKFVANVATGTAEIRVNGVPVDGIDPATAINTGTQYSQFRIDNPNSTSGPSFYFKDLIVWDGNGAKNNDFLGTRTVFGRTTTADIAFPWTPSTGTTGWNLLDNSPPLDATDYISAGDPPPAAAKFALTQLPEDVTSIAALITQVRARKVDGGDGTLQVGLVSGASTALGADRPITTAFTYYEDIFESDPATGTNWTPAAADAAQLQVNRTT